MFLVLKKYNPDLKPVIVFGVCWWNHTSLTTLLKSQGHNPIFTHDFSSAIKLAKQHQSEIIAWASRCTDENIHCAEQQNIKLSFVEDGFLRSVGLGAGLIAAISLVIDKRGIYYNCKKTSDLEWMLENETLTKHHGKRGKSIRQMIVDQRLTKYNLVKQKAQKLGQPPLLSRSDFPQGKLVILVPGQVSDDASILTNRSDVIDLNESENINLKLLQAVRAKFPESYIIYKPHPDVQSGLRDGAIEKAKTDQLADAIIDHLDITTLIDAVDRVEVFSSLAGFEALLRGKKVGVYGVPFYAGWGLTTDLGSVPARRGARPSILGLVHAALIDYPRYFDPITGTACPVEVAIERLAQNEPAPTGIANRLLSKLQGVFATYAPLWR